MKAIDARDVDAFARVLTNDAVLQIFWPEGYGINTLEGLFGWDNYSEYPN